MLSDLDRDALERALAIAQKDPEEAASLAEKLEDRDWEDVAKSAAYWAQTRSLHLKPWDTPPMYGEAETQRNRPERPALRLLEKMLAAGLSRYEPDPIAALEEKQRENNK